MKHKLKAKIRILILMIVSFHFVSCFPSYSVLPKEYKNLKSPKEKIKVFVINEDLKDEFKILENSKIYEIVKDSNLASIKIKLNPIKNITGFRCGNMMAGSMITFGILPYFDSGRYVFSYDEISGYNTKNIEYTFEIRESFWLFNLFYPKSFKKQSGKALLGNYLDKKYKIT